MIKKKENNNAVSPVVGVMLMLVVTIIIAAVVSAFAGGMTSGTSKAPQMSIKAQFSNTTGFTITHTGGDNINTLTSKIIVSPTADFGSYQQLRWSVNTSVVMIKKYGANISESSEKPWFNPNLTSSYQARTFQNGETAFINQTNLNQVQPKTYSSNTDNPPTDAYSTYYGFMCPSFVGQQFNLRIVDDSGRTIAQTLVTINP